VWYGRSWLPDGRLRAAALALALAAVLPACSGSGGADARSVLSPGSRTSAAQPATPASTSAGPTRPAPATGATAVGPVTLLFTGDMLVSDSLRERALRYAGGRGFDFRPMLGVVAPLIRAADWAVCHQETPISADNHRLSGYPSFNAPYQLAAAERWAGYDSCTTASNHTVDQGMPGVQATLDTLDRFGIRHVGSARTPREAQRLTIYEVGGARVGHLSYTYGLNGIEPPTRWAVNLIDPTSRVRADARRLRQAGAQFVIVSLHFGTEKDQRPSEYQRRVVEDVLASPDVDLVVGHHAHVVQPVQRRRDGRWVIYGLGNFLAQMVARSDPRPPHRDGVIIRVTIGPAPSGRYVVTRVGYVPTFVDAPADIIRVAPDFSRRRTIAALTAYRAPLVDDTPPP
jgi:Bacterial capsule synthesis protein PGA_cap